MADPVIEIENLYKEYRLGLIGYGTLREDLQSWWAKARGKEDPNSILFSGDQSRDGKASDHILALNNINIEVKQGERLGIIGANGAGKTTLLKILSRIASPTKGAVRIKGRVASLIAVGTGFHGELTGRDNIYLNGAILGLRKFEIDERFDEIVDFAGVSQFMDTPVKRYSSGMYVRLGFAVAAHLDPDVLIVDEVLAVGDAEFRKKALSKMKDVSEGQGRTILFVSHNMDAIKQLCERAILLESGELVSEGSATEVVEQYLAAVTDDEQIYFGERIWDGNHAPGNDVVRLMAIRTKNEKGEVCKEFDVTEQVTLEIEYQVLKEKYQLALSVIIVSHKREWLFTLPDDYVRGPWGRQEPKREGKYKASYTIPGNLMTNGRMNFSLDIYAPPGAANLSGQIKVNKALSITIVDDFNENGVRGSYPYHWGSPSMRPYISCITERI
jgi:lipopolysaccharide transport system ATP-binding protein|tara:strand:- start:660 stop:1988 length:1329 start_codon:yes stop_codon:yes gene_type:complete